MMILLLNHHRVDNCLMKTKLFETLEQNLVSAKVIPEVRLGLNSFILLLSKLLSRIKLGLHSQNKDEWVEEVMTRMNKDAVGIF